MLEQLCRPRASLKLCKQHFSRLIDPLTAPLTAPLTRLSIVVVFVTVASAPYDVSILGALVCSLCPIA